VSNAPQNCTKGDIDEVKDRFRFELQPNDVVIMQLGNTGVGKSSICQALTDNLNFRIGTENGTTLVPRAGVMPNDICPNLRMVLIDVPGLNQAVVAENRRLFVQHPGVPGKKKLELEDIEELIVKLAELMMVCLIVVDQKILQGFKDVYKKVLALLAKGVRESDPEKYENKSDDDLHQIVKNRIIFVRNKCDYIYDHQNPEENIKKEEDDIRQVLELTDEPIHFVVAGAYSAKKGQGNFSDEAVHRLTNQKFLKTIDDLKKTINDKVHEHAQALIEQCEAKNARNEILKEAAKVGADRIQQRHQPGHVFITMLAIVPNAARYTWYSIIEKRWNIGCGIDNTLEKKVPLHDHPLSMFLGHNIRRCYICQVCRSKTDKGAYMQVWWYCERAECKSINGKFYVVHEECAEIYETMCDKSSAENSEEL
jgi:GTPase SAR1 family protein